MPYRRLPKTDAVRLKALETVINSNELYTVENRFVKWNTLNEAQRVYKQLSAANQQYTLNFNAQSRSGVKIEKLQHNAEMYLSHFVQVLFLAMQRGEIKESNKELYALKMGEFSLPDFKTYEGLLNNGKNIIEGEKLRIKKGGRPIYNPTIGMVSTHYDIFREAYEKQKRLQERTSKSMDALKVIRPETDRVILDLWNQIEMHFEKEPVDVRVEKCRQFGVVYYYRSGEKKKEE